MNTTIDMNEREILGLLRNPYGIQEDLLRTARQLGADMLEKRGRAIRMLRENLKDRGVDLTDFDEYFKGVL